MEIVYQSETFDTTQTRVWRLTFVTMSVQSTGHCLPFALWSSRWRRRTLARSTPASFSMHRNVTNNVGAQGNVTIYGNSRFTQTILRSTTQNHTKYYKLWYIAPFPAIVPTGTTLKKLTVSALFSFDVVRVECSSLRRVTTKYKQVPHATNVDRAINMAIRIMPRGNGSSGTVRRILGGGGGASTVSLVNSVTTADAHTEAFTPVPVIFITSPSVTL